MSENYDVVIAGGGMVGVSLALQLANSLPTATSILLLESFPLPQPGQSNSSDYHPSFDARSTALSYSSKLIYAAMNVWEDLQQWVCPIERIHVSSRGHFGSTLLQAADHGWPALGYVVENAWLGRGLLAALHRQGRVEARSPVRVVAVEPSANGTCLQLEGAGATEIEAGLLLVADGANSGLCEQLGVAINSKPYDQHALIANIASKQPHLGCAYERFTDEGPLALLPLPGTPGADNRSALVWTLSPSRAEQLQSCGEDEFLRELQQRFGYRLGRLHQVGERQSYPLQLVQSTEQVRQGVAVVGNAAHALHPVAGQGFNLALRDVAQLCLAIAQGVAAGGAPGDLRQLEQFRRAQQQDQARTIGFSDRVPDLFMHSDPVLSLGRDLVLSGMDFLPALKREFVRQAAGVASLAEYVETGHSHAGKSGRAGGW